MSHAPSTILQHLRSLGEALSSASDAQLQEQFLAALSRPGPSGVTPAVPLLHGAKRGRGAGAAGFSVLLVVATALGCLASPLLAPATKDEIPAAPRKSQTPPAVPPVPLPEGAWLRLGTFRLRHGTEIRSAALSPDGKRLATAAPRSVVLWDLARGTPLRHFPVDRSSGFVSPGLAFAADGRRLGFVQGRSFACVWDLGTGKEVWKDEGGARSQSFCRFTPDGRQFVVGEGDHARFIDLATGKTVRTVRAKGVALVALDCKTFVRTDEKKEIVFGSLTTGKAVWKLHVAAARNGAEEGIVLTPDGRSLAIVHIDKGVEVRDVPGGNLRASFALPEKARKTAQSRYPDYRVGLTPDARMVLLGTSDGLVHRWDVPGRRPLPPLAAHTKLVTGVLALPDSRSLITTGADGLVRLWDLKTGKEQGKTDAYSGAAHAVCSPDGRLVAVWDGAGRFDLWDTRQGKVARVVRREGKAVGWAAFAPGGHSVAAAERSGDVRVFDVGSGRETARLPWGEARLPAAVCGIQYSPDGRSLLVSDSCNELRLWDLAARKVRWRAGRAECASVFSPDGKTVVVAPGGLEVVLLDAGTGKQRSRLWMTTRADEGHPNFVTAVAISPDGHRLAAALYEGDVVLFDLEHEAVIRRFTAVAEIKNLAWRANLRGRGTGNRVTALAFAADSRWLASGGTDCTVRVWEVATGREVLRRDGHEGEITSVGFLPGGRSLLSSGGDGQAYLWHLRPGRPTGAPPRAAPWEELMADATRAYRAAWALTEDTEAAVALLREKLPPTKADASRATVLKHIANLDAGRFRTRAAATKALAALGPAAGPLLREMLPKARTLEHRRRIEGLLGALARPEPTADELRVLRAVYAVELCGTAAARRLLQSWADGTPGLPLTEQAKASRARLSR